MSICMKHFYFSVHSLKKNGFVVNVKGGKEPGMLHHIYIILGVVINNRGNSDQKGQLTPLQHTHRQKNLS